MKRLLAMWVTILVLSPLGYSAYAAPQHTSTAPAKPHQMSADDGAEPSLSGKVVEAMNAGGYTYVLLEKKGKKTWVAVSEMKVAVGQNMAFLPGSAMPQFTSKSLNRTFDVIYFSAGPVVTSSSVGKKSPDASPASKAAASTAEKGIKVEKAAGANAYTVAEVYKQVASLNGKTVVVKGKVVKVSAGVMGMNWVHLQDGTGDPKNGSNNLVATSDDLPAKGDIVTLKGIITKDKDYGSGYKYSVIMEKGSIQR